MASAEVAAAIKKLLPSKLPPSLSSQPANLYQVLSRYPRDGVGQRIHQTRWGVKGIEGCYWKVSRTKLKLEGTHGKAWGRLYWRGKCVSEQDEKIPGGLKYKWIEGESRAPPPPKTK
ncbi:hypothetical protein NLI96_g5257 [Meripilus lineatus]|uniref:Uncharacterized protein n=1 Tax=Meripilus lineatus TaxID=2056292 RepID=A0AAD5YJB0_9APHY|nr:hypothetical protein NLI96_g5257 [Physisporinus lineatus]